MRGRVEAVRRHIEARFNLGDQLDIRTKRVRPNNVFEVLFYNISSDDYKNLAILDRYRSVVNWCTRENVETGSWTTRGKSPPFCDLSSR